ncbi:Xylulose kinase [hydrothermal vent metagenome]|uniref:Xylulose kinase n=1 Tax=hydrothermal vent metagenome TaxID=652676 RepID=A0A3B0TKW3_9ZZZZ
MYLGIDLGTSSVKALLMDGDHGIVASATADLEVSRPHSGWSEQDPADWISATGTALDALKAKADLSPVAGIGLSGQQHGATLLDAADRPLRPCILWNDARAGAEAAELDGNPKVRALTGNVILAGYTSPKLRWVQAHEPEIFAQTARILLPKDYLRLWLTGEYVSDMSDASGMGWLEIARRDWSEDLLAISDLGLEHMPALVEGTEVSGQLKRGLASRWGISGTPVVAGGGGDNAASAAGVGVVRPNTAFVSLGTSGVFFVSNDRFRPNAESAVHAFCHALPGLWHQMGVILSAAAALEWLCGITGKSAAGLTGALGDTLKAPSPVKFLPYLAGERTPHKDASLRGAFAGLDLATSVDDLTQAVLEGVAFAFVDSRDALAAAGTELTSTLAVGGGSRSEYWLKVIATALDMPIHVPAAGDIGAAFGAARLGLIAAEGADPLTVLTQPEIEATVEPDAKLADAFAEAIGPWRALTPAIKGAIS